MAANSRWDRSSSMSGRFILHWGRPMKNRDGEKYDVAATMGIELVHDAARFTLRIENDTP